MKCSNCSQDLICSKDQSCWCNIYPTILEIDDSKTCLCNTCLKTNINKKIDLKLNNLTEETITEIKKLGAPEKLIEGIDYYINNDHLYVFTSWYHLRKGFCCNNDCKHCPY